MSKAAPATASCCCCFLGFYLYIFIPNLVYNISQKLNMLLGCRSTISINATIITLKRLKNSLLKSYVQIRSFKLITKDSTIISPIILQGPAKKSWNMWKQFYCNLFQTQEAMVTPLGQMKTADLLKAAALVKSNKINFW